MNIREILGMAPVIPVLTLSDLAHAVPLAAALVGQSETAKGPAVRLQLNEVQAGSMAAEQYCTVVFADRHFHSEKASRSHGKDMDRKVYEGTLSETDWNALGGIIDSDGFRALNVAADPGLQHEVHHAADPPRAAGQGS